MEVSEFIIGQLRDRLAELDVAREKVERAASDYEDAKSRNSSYYMVRAVRMAEGKLRRARQAELEALVGIAGVARLIVSLEETHKGLEIEEKTMCSARHIDV